MSKIKCEIELDWFKDISDDGESGTGDNLDEAIQRMVVETVAKRIESRVERSCSEALEKTVKETIEVKVGEYLKNIMSNEIANIKIPHKSSEWNAEVKYLSLTEYIGQKYNSYLKEKRLNERGEVTTSSYDAKYSITDFYLNQGLTNLLNKEMGATLKTFKANLIKSVTDAMQNQIKQQLSDDVLAKVNLQDIANSLVSNAIDQR